MQSQSFEAVKGRRIVLLRNRGENLEVFLDEEGTTLVLPRLQISRGLRVAEQLTIAFREMYDIEAVSISSFALSTGESTGDPIVCEIMESCGPHREDLDDMHWVAMDGLFEGALSDPIDSQALKRAVAQSTAYDETGPRGPFAHLGWFPQLEQWVQEEIRPKNLRLSGRFRQLNASPAFSLIRFETDGAPALWFKAVGAPNERECTITLALARAFPRSLPEIIAVRTEWNAWLSLEAEGPLLIECAGHEAWEEAARDLARLQIDSIGGLGQLLSAGARDLGNPALRSLVEPFFQTMGEVMELEGRIVSPRLSAGQLGVLSARVSGALAVLEETGLPPTLGHLDFNPRNIVVSPAGCVFLDWAEGFVGHPFLTFEYLREHLRRAFAPAHLDEANLVDRYLSPWREIAPESSLLRALEAASLLAVFAFAVGNDAWMNPQQRHEPRTAAYLRALTRRMDREAHPTPDRSQLCPK